MEKNICLQLYKVHSTYDREIDDWCMDKLESMDQIVILRSASQEEICNKVKINRKKHQCLISKNDIFVVDKVTQKPVFCLKKA